MKCYWQKLKVKQFRGMLVRRNLEEFSDFRQGGLGGGFHPPCQIRLTNICQTILVKNRKNGSAMHEVFIVNIWINKQISCTVISLHYPPLVSTCTNATNYNHQGQAEIHGDSDKVCIVNTDHFPHTKMNINIYVYAETLLKSVFLIWSIDIDNNSEYNYKLRKSLWSA